MAQRRAAMWMVVTAAMVAVVGCKSSNPAQPPPTASGAESISGGGAGAGGGGGGGASSQQMRLMTVLRDYQLPAQTVPAARNSEPQVDAVLQKMMAVATQQGLIFDGSRGAEGVIVVGRQGKSGKPMLVAVAVYPKSGRVAMQDLMSANGLDSRDAERMKEKYLGAL